MKIKCMLGLLMLLLARPAGAQCNGGTGATCADQSTKLVSSAHIPEEVGIYAVWQGNVWREVQAETVEVRRGGMWGLDGRVANPRSPLRLSRPQQFLIRLAEGYSASEYRLLKLDAKKDHRQFRALTVRVGGARDDAQKNALPFTAEKINNHSWLVRLSLENGEYAFFSPQIHSEGIGKSLTYTFGVDSIVEGVPASMPSPATSGATPAPTGPQGTLGVSGADWEQGGVKGVEIVKLSGDSSAELAGLHRGDVITDVNGKNLRSTRDLASVLAQMEPGSKISIGYLIKTQIGWMPKETIAILAKTD